MCRALFKYIDLKKNLEIKLKNEDASEHEIKGLAVLIRCLGESFQITLRIAPNEKNSTSFCRRSHVGRKPVMNLFGIDMGLFASAFSRWHSNQRQNRQSKIWSRIDIFIENTTLAKRNHRALHSIEDRIRCNLRGQAGGASVIVRGGRGCTYPNPRAARPPNLPLPLAIITLPSGRWLLEIERKGTHIGSTGFYHLN